VGQVQGDRPRRARGERHRMLTGQALTCGFASFAAVRAFPPYTAESPWEVPRTDVKVPEKSLGGPWRTGGLTWVFLPKHTRTRSAVPVDGDDLLLVWTAMSRIRRRQGHRWRPRVRRPPSRVLEPRPEVTQDSRSLATRGRCQAFPDPAARGPLR
jgi:hypothetical protein